MLYKLKVVNGVRCVLEGPCSACSSICCMLLCILEPVERELCLLEAVEDELCFLEVLEVMCCMLLCTLEAVEGRLRFGVSKFLLRYVCHRLD